MYAVANDDVIADGDAEKLASADESTRELDVVDARCRVAAGVIVGDDDGGGVGQNGHLENFARMDERGVELAAADFGYSRRWGDTHANVLANAAVASGRATRRSKECACEGLTLTSIYRPHRA